MAGGFAFAFDYSLTWYWRLLEVCTGSGGMMYRFHKGTICMVAWCSVPGMPSPGLQRVL